MKSPSGKGNVSNFPVSAKNESSLQKKSKNNILQKVTSDAFNIISRTSATETVIGAWVFDKNSVDRLKTLCDEVDFLSPSFLDFHNHHKQAARHLELWSMKDNPQDAFFILNSSDLLRRTYLLLPSQQKTFVRNGIDKDEFLKKFADFRMYPLRYLNLQEIDTQTQYLNCEGMPKTEIGDFSKFDNLLELDCIALGLRKLIISPQAKIDHLNCSYNRNLTELILFPGNIQHSLDISMNFEGLKSLDLEYQPELKLLDAENCHLNAIKLYKNNSNKEDLREITINIVGNRLFELDLSGYDDVTISCDDDIKRLIMPILKFDEHEEKVVKKLKYILNKETNRLIKKIPENWDVKFTPRKNSK